MTERIILKCDARLPDWKRKVSNDTEICGRPMRLTWSKHVEGKPSATCDYCGHKQFVSRELARQMLGLTEQDESSDSFLPKFKVE